MIFHEGGNEVVAVVVAGLHAQAEGDPGLRAGLTEQFGAKLFGKERIRIAEVDHDSISVDVPEDILKVERLLQK